SNQRTSADRGWRCRRLAGFPRWRGCRAAPDRARESRRTKGAALASCDARFREGEVDDAAVARVVDVEHAVDVAGLRQHDRAGISDVRDGDGDLLLRIVILF